MVIRKLQLNPAAIIYVVNALAAMSVAWGIHLTAQQTGAVDTIVTGILTVITAFLVRPVAVSTVTAAAATVLTAFTAWGLHLSSDQIAASAAVASVALGFLLHTAGVPTVAAKQGKTATQILLAPPNPGAQ